jgi:hypothetical protein
MSPALIRRLSTFATVMVLVALFPAVSRSQDLGEFCVALNPLPDTIRLSATETGGPTTMVSLVFRWRFGTSAQVLGTGAITESLQAGRFDLALTGTHGTTFFGGNKICSLSAVLQPPAFGGPWQYTCTGAGGAPFTSSGTITVVACTPAM